MNKKHRLILIFTFIFVIFGNAVAAVPSAINLQLHLLDPDGAPISGNVALTIRLFDGEHSNNVLYTNDIADRYVQATEGFVNYYIKNVYGVDFSKEIWAEITIDGNTMPQRIRFSTAPYAFFAARAQTADIVDTANVALSVLDNSITSNHIANATITNTDIAPSTILPSNINAGSTFDWTGQHSFQSNSNELTLNSANYALEITKGTAKLLALEGDKITASYILTDTFSAKMLKAIAVQTDTLAIANYIFSKNNNTLTIKDTATAAGGIVLSAQTLSYIVSPTFAADDKNAIINKEYVDSTAREVREDFNSADSAILATITEMSGTLNDSLKPLASKIDTVNKRIDTVRANLNSLTSGLTANRLAKWDGTKLTNSNIIEQGNLVAYTAPNLAFAAKDSAALVNKRYVDKAVDSAIKHVDEGIYASLSDSTLPMWSATKNIFINSKISEGRDTIRIGGTRFIIEDLPLTTSIIDINHLNSNSLWTSNIWAKGIATNIAEYSLIDPITKLPENAAANTLVPVAYVTKVADSLVHRIETDSVDGTRLKAGTVADSKIKDLSGNKIKPYTVAGGYNGQLVLNSIISENIRSGSIEDTHIVSGAVFSRHILDGSIETVDLAAGLIDSSKIAVNSIDSTHLSDGGISTSDLAAGAITNEKIALETITGDKIDINTIPGNRLTERSITRREIQLGEIFGYHLADSSLTNSKLNVSEIRYNSSNLVDNHYMPDVAAPQTLTTKQYVDTLISAVNTEPIDGHRIKPGTITSDKIITGEIRSPNIAAGAVLDDKLDVSNIQYLRNDPLSNYMPSDSTPMTLTTKSYVDKVVGDVSTTEISGERIADGTITTIEIEDETIQSEDIAPNAVNYQNIVAGAVRDEHIRVGSISYKGNESRANNMPEGANGATLATVDYVNNSMTNMAFSGKLESSNADVPSLEVGNTAVGGGVALKIAQGAMMLSSYIDFDVSAGNLNDYYLPAGYIVYNLHGDITLNGGVNVHLPVPTQVGQIIYISNNATKSARLMDDGINFLNVDRVYPDEIGTLISVRNHKDGGKLVWRRTI